MGPRMSSRNRVILDTPSGKHATAQLPLTLSSRVAVHKLTVRNDNPDTSTVASRDCDPGAAASSCNKFVSKVSSISTQVNRFIVPSTGSRLTEYRGTAQATLRADVLSQAFGADAMMSLSLSLSFQ